MTFAQVCSRHRRFRTSCLAQRADLRRSLMRLRSPCSDAHLYHSYCLGRQSECVRSNQSRCRRRSQDRSAVYRRLWPFRWSYRGRHGRHLFVRRSWPISQKGEQREGSKADSGTGRMNTLPLISRQSQDQLAPRIYSRASNGGVDSEGPIDNTAPM